MTDRERLLKALMNFDHCDNPQVVVNFNAPDTLQYIDVPYVDTTGESAPEPKMLPAYESPGTAFVKWFFASLTITILIFAILAVLAHFYA
jgi:hypothetical protein